MAFGDFAFGAGIGSQAENLYQRQLIERENAEMAMIQKRQQFQDQQSARAGQQSARARTGGGGGRSGGTTADNSQQAEAEAALRGLTKNTVNNALAKFYETGDGKDFMAALKADPAGKATKLLGDVKDINTLSAWDVAEHRDKFDKEHPELKKLSDEEVAKTLGKRYATFTYIDPKTGELERSIEDLVALAPMTGYHKTADKNKIDLYIKASNTYDKHGNIKGSADTRLKNALLYAIAHDAPKEDIKQLQNALNTLKGKTNVAGSKLSLSMGAEKAFTAPIIKKLEDALNSGASEATIKKIQNELYEAKERFKQLDSKYRKGSRSSRSSSGGGGSTSNYTATVHAALKSKIGKELYNLDSKDSKISTHPKTSFITPSGVKIGLTTVEAKGVNYAVGSPTEARDSLMIAKEVLGADSKEYKALKDQIDEMYPAGSFKKGGAIYNSLRARRFDPNKLAAVLYPNSTKSQKATYAGKIALAKDAAIKDAKAQGVGLNAVIIEKWLNKALADSSAVKKYLAKETPASKADGTKEIKYEGKSPTAIYVGKQKLTVPSIKVNGKMFPQTIAGTKQAIEEAKKAGKNTKALDDLMTRLQNNGIGSFIADGYIKGLSKADIADTLKDKLAIEGKSSRDKVVSALAALESDMAGMTTLDPATIQQLFNQHYAESTRDRSKSIGQGSYVEKEKRIMATTKKVFGTDNPLEVPYTKFISKQAGKDLMLQFKGEEKIQNEKKDIGLVSEYKDNKSNPIVAELLAKSMNILERIGKLKKGANFVQEVGALIQNYLPNIPAMGITESGSLAIIANEPSFDKIATRLSSSDPHLADLWNKMDSTAKKGLRLILKQISGQAVSDKEYQGWREESLGSFGQNFDKRAVVLGEFFNYLETKTRAAVQALYDKGYKYTAMKMKGGIETAKMYLPKGAESTYKGGYSFNGDTKKIYGLLRAGKIRVKDLTKADKKALKAYLLKKGVK